MKQMDKKTLKKVHVWVRAVIQLLYFLFIPSAYTAAFNGVKYIFTQMGAKSHLELTSFVVTLIALCLFTVVFGRFFCGFACAFGSLGDAVRAFYVFICKKRKKKPVTMKASVVKYLQAVKYVVLVLLVVSCYTGVYSKTRGMSPWDVFSMLTAGRLPGAAYKVGIVLLILLMIGMCTQERFFCQFLCPMGAIFAIMPIAPSALFNRDRSTCPAKCGACKKRCPAHLDIDGDTSLSGECICCHACQGICPKRNIRIGIPKAKDESLFYAIGNSVGIPYSIKSPAGQDRTAAER